MRQKYVFETQRIEPFEQKAITFSLECVFKLGYSKKNETLIINQNQNYNICFKKTGTKGITNTLLLFVPVFMKQTLIQFVRLWHNQKSLEVHIRLIFHGLTYLWIKSESKIWKHIGRIFFSMTGKWKSKRGCKKIHGYSNP